MSPLPQQPLTIQAWRRNRPMAMCPLTTSTTKSC